MPLPPLRHVWGTDHHGRLLGLLLKWRKRPDGWHGRIGHAVQDAEGWAIVEEWLPPRSSSRWPWWTDPILPGIELTFTTFSARQPRS